MGIILFLTIKEAISNISMKLIVRCLVVVLMISVVESRTFRNEWACRSYCRRDCLVLESFPPQFRCPFGTFGRSEMADVRSEIADVNGDGAIDRNEFNWAFPNVDLYEEFGKLDTNNDGFIDETEGRGILFNKLIKGAKKLFNKIIG